MDRRVRLLLLVAMLLYGAAAGVVVLQGSVNGGHQSR
jgi:hypothetical protein